MYWTVANDHGTFCFQDLQYLSEDLEGRSNNPVALLFDTLMHPNADYGEHHPPALVWKHSPSRTVSHIVLGSGEPGGSWHSMKSDIQSLSLSSWLELPEYRFASWEDERYSHRKKSEGRVSLGDIAQYYSDYVSKMGLQDNFMNGVKVDSVAYLERKSSQLFNTSRHSSECTPEPESCDHLVNSPPLCKDSSLKEEETNSAKFALAADDSLFLEDGYFSYNLDKFFCTMLQSRDVSPVSRCNSDTDESGVYCCATMKNCQRSGYKWCVRATKVEQSGHKQRAVVCAKNLVLACGVGGNPKRLNIPGENLPFVKHRFSDLPPKLPELENSSHPVVVVGAGLSAADAILLLLSRGVKVVHVFYQDPSNSKLIYHKMPPEQYHEYRHIFNLMQGKVKSKQYVPMSRHNVTEFKSEGVCVIQSQQDTLTEIVSSLALVLIGSEANLDFLPEDILLKLGVHSSRPIHTKHNPVDIDPISFESENVSSLYALGPLVGDNFVRFGLGSALGASQHMYQKL